MSADIRFPLTAVLIVSVFVLDLTLPLGWAVWLLYVLPLLLAFRFTGRRHLYLVASASTALMVGAYLFDAPKNIPHEIIVFNRALGIFVLWVTAFFLTESARGEEARGRLAAIVEYSADAIIGMTLDGTIVTWNMQARRMFGYSSREVMGKAASFLLPPDRADEETQIIERILRGEHIAHFETVRRRKDGNPIYISMSISPIKDAGDNIVGFSKIARDITEHKRAEEENSWLFEQVTESRERLRALSRRLLQVQEEERRTLACELHDEIGQALTAIKINLQAALRLHDMSRITARMEDCTGLVDSMLARVRGRSLDLRPPLLDELGLAPALKWYVSAQAQRAGLMVDLAVDSLTVRFPADLEIACFRVVQEALTNVIRHARASRVSVAIQTKNGRLELSVRDDGCGFDVRTAMKNDIDRMHIGLLGMHERIRILRGQISIDSVPMRGTEVQASIPLHAHQTGVLITS